MGKTPYLKPIPPKVRRSASRPKKNRRKDGNECVVIGGKLKRSYNVWTCSTCKQGGHNSRGCPHKPPVPVEEEENQQTEARAKGVETRADGHEVRDEVAEARTDGQQLEGNNVQVVETQTEIPLSQSGPLGDQPSQEAETSRPSKKRKTYGLRAPVVYPDDFGARPLPIRGPQPLQPPIIRGPPLF